MNFRNFITFTHRRVLPVLLLTATVVLSTSMLRAGEDEGAGIRAEKRREPALSTLTNPIKVTMSSVPFEFLRPDGFIVREVVVQNDSPAPANVAIYLRFTDRFYAQTFSRSVSVTRQIPAGSRQTIPLFVPADYIDIHGAHDYNSYFNSANPQIYVNGRPYRPIPSGFTDGANLNSKALPLPSSFSNEEPMAELIALAITGTKDWSSSLFSKRYATPLLPNGDKYEYTVSGSDTIQWPTIPQFYQSMPLIFRKTSDTFAPDAERAIHDAVMLGATEVLIVTPGSPWPEWAPRPSWPSMPSIVARGFGQSVVIGASTLHFPTPPVTTAAPNRPQSKDYDEEEYFDRFGRSGPMNRTDAMQLANANIPLTTELQNANILAFNPAPIFLALPHVDIPSIPFILVILALLAYIIIVGPVNYFYLVRKKKSVLLLLLTVPLISIAFVAVVIFFVAIVEGWSSTASAVGVTFLDQKENMAYTRAAVNLYAPVPVRTLTFDPADSVLFSNTKDINVSLGRNQVITGTNRARVPLAYSISRAEKRLEQLKVTHGADGVSVVNGLGAPLNKLILKTDDGEIWTAPGVIAPGESARLDKFDGRVMTKEDVESTFESTFKQLRDLGSNSYHFPFNGMLLTAAGLLFEMPTDLPVEKRRMNLPDSIYGSKIATIAKWEIFAMKYCTETPGFLESVLPAGMYLAETGEPLFYSPGCKPVTFRARHIVFGAFAAQEATNEN